MDTPHRTVCIAILGPTASGKSEFALRLAEELGGEILCMDSTTVYQGFDVGSAKPSRPDRDRIPHHLLDILRPEESFNAFEFVRRAETTLGEVEQRGKAPLVVGGTYFYLRALQHGMYPVGETPAETAEAIENRYTEGETVRTDRMHADLKEKDPGSAERIHPNDRYRLLRALAILETTGQPPSQLKPEPLSAAQAGRVWLKYALTLPRHVLWRNIERRTERMLADGLIDEVRELRRKWPQARALGAVGYAETCRFLDGELSEFQLKTQIVEKTRQLAKRQLTWLRSDPEVRFVDAEDADRVKLEWENLQVAMGNAR